MNDAQPPAYLTAQCRATPPDVRSVTLPVTSRCDFRSPEQHRNAADQVQVRHNTLTRSIVVSKSCVWNAGENVSNKQGMICVPPAHVFMNACAIVHKWHGVYLCWKLRSGLYGVWGYLLFSADSGTAQPLTRLTAVRYFKYLPPHMLCIRGNIVIKKTPCWIFHRTVRFDFQVPWIAKMWVLCFKS